MPTEDVPTTSKIASILEILGDGKWHRLSEIQQRIKTSRNNTKRIAEFLSEYEFIVIDQTRERIRLNDVAKFLSQTSTA